MCRSCQEEGLYPQSALERAYGDGESLHRRRFEFMPQIGRGREQLPLYMASRKSEIQSGLAKRIRFQHEMPGNSRADLNGCSIAIFQRKPVQKSSRPPEVHAGHQGEIIHRLQQPEMIKDGWLGPLLRRELAVCGNLVQ